MGIDLQSFMMGAASGNGGIQPTGSTTITENGEYDVSSYASAIVNTPVASGSTTLTENGEYNVSSYATAIVDVAGSGGDNMGFTLLRSVECQDNTQRSFSFQLTAEELQTYNFYLLDIDVELTATDWVYANAYQNNYLGSQNAGYNKLKYKLPFFCAATPNNFPNTYKTHGMDAGRYISYEANLSTYPIRVYTYSTSKFFKVGSKIKLYGFTQSFT